MPTNIELLENLCLTAGTPGREHRVRELILEEVKPLVDEIEVDAMGSIIACKKAKAPSKSTKSKTSTNRPKRVMIAAHMDQIGFLVKHIDDKGFVRVVPTGGFDTRNLFARLVTISPDIYDPKKDITGIMNPGGKPVHISSPEERNKVPTIDDFVIDTALPADEVKKKVKIGDMVTLQAPFKQLGKAIVSQAMDNRVACWVGIEALRKLKSKKLNADVYVVFTVQEEVGLRGAVTGAFSVEPDIGIAVDVTLACDTPGVPAEHKTSDFGGGAVITVADSASIGDYDLVEAVEGTARKNKITHQRSILARGGTDAGGIQRSRHGVKTITLSVPTRYIHTVIESIHEDDLFATRDLVAAYLQTVK